MVTGLWGLVVGVALAQPAEGLMRAPGVIPMTFLCTTPLTEEILPRIEDRLREGGFELAPELPPWEDLARPLAVVKVAPDLEGPDADYLEFQGRGLDDADVAALQGPHVGFWLLTAAPTPHQDAVVRLMGPLAAEIAGECDAYLWDDATREVFDIEAWVDTRVTQVDADPVLSVMDHMLMHSYEDGDLLRIVSLGMGKLGLPDLVVEGVPRGNGRATGMLVNLAAQTMVEQGGLSSASMSLDIGELANAQIRSFLSADWLEGATGRVDVVLNRARRDKGDPDNVLFLVEVQGVAGSTPTERLGSGLTQLFGTEDTLTWVDHKDNRLVKLQQEALEALTTTVKQRYKAGLPLGTRFLVKGPFETASGGLEWMWVEVTRWRGKTIRGVLANDPHDVPDLVAGARVKLKERELFDYVLYFADGREEGNTTGAYLEWLQQKK